jgi:hypothetical protein
MENIGEIKASRKQITIRLLFTLLYLVIFEILKLIVQVTAVFQFIYLLVTQNYSKPLRTFSNKVATYAYKVIRYATLNDNFRPFPFNEFPSEMEQPEQDVKFE